jgi:hypothetical protein
MFDSTKITQRIEELIEKRNRVLATHAIVDGLPTLESGIFTEWSTQTLSLLVNFLGQNHIYVSNFEKHVDRGFQSSVDAG